MSGISRKYKSSTLIEVLVAMSIILICAGLGMTAVTNLNRDINGNQKIDAEIYLTKVLNDTKIDKDFTDKTFEFAAFRIERTLLPYKDEKRIKILRLEAFNTINRKVGEIKELIKTAQ